MISILCHVYYESLWGEINYYLKKIECSNLYVNLINPDFVNTIKKDQPSAKIIVSPNQGRDIGGYLRLISRWVQDKSPGDLLILCHTKKKVKWRRSLMNAIFNDIDNIKCIFEDASVGLVGSSRWLVCNPFDVNNNIHEYYCRRFNLHNYKPLFFVAGTIFCIRASIFRYFFYKFNAEELAKELELPDAINNDVVEPSKTHAWERLFCTIANQNHLIKPANCPKQILDNFNEYSYLNACPDVRKLIANFKIHSGLVHFLNKKSQNDKIKYI